MSPEPASPATRLLQPIVYHTCHFLARVAFTLVYRVRVFDVLNIPARGAVLIAANHESHLDPPLVGSSIAHRPMFFIARAGLFRSRAFGWLIRQCNSSPIQESGSDTAAIREVLRRLAEGRAVLIFPEGSRSENGELQAFKRGVALLVSRAGCPVVPAAVEGCFEAWPRSRARPRLMGQRVSVAFGRAIAHEELMRDGPDAALSRLRDEIAALRAGLERRKRGRRGDAVAS